MPAATGFVDLALAGAGGVLSGFAATADCCGELVSVGSSTARRLTYAVSHPALQSLLQPPPWQPARALELCL